MFGQNHHVQLLGHVWNVAVLCFSETKMRRIDFISLQEAVEDNRSSEIFVL